MNNANECVLQIVERNLKPKIAIQQLRCDRRQFYGKLYGFCANLMHFYYRKTVTRMYESNCRKYIVEFIMNTKFRQIRKNFAITHTLYPF
jgi:hypothetical protein